MRNSIHLNGDFGADMICGGFGDSYATPPIINSDVAASYAEAAASAAAPQILYPYQVTNTTAVDTQVKISIVLLGLASIAFVYYISKKLK